MTKLLFISLDTMFKLSKSTNISATEKIFTEYKNTLSNTRYVTRIRYENKVVPTKEAGVQYVI